LLDLSVSKFILFGGRLLLAHNEQLYPYHKWLLRVLAELQDKPAGLMEQIDQVATSQNAEAIESLYQSIRNFREWASPVPWPFQFMIDSELNWMDGKTPVDDL